MTTPPELDLASKVASIVSGLINAWKFGKEQWQAMPKRTRLWGAGGLLLLLLLSSAVGFGYWIGHSPAPHVASAPASVQPKPAPPPAAAPTPAPGAPPVQAPAQQPRPTKPPIPRKPQIKPAAPSAPATTVGTDSTVYGTIPPGSRVGDRSVYMGATDAQGNTRISGGTAVGTGASADPTTVAIGENAGSHPPPVTINSAPGGFAVSGGTLTNPTVNNYGPSTRHLTGEQKAALSDPAIKQACTLSNTPLDIQWEPVEEAGTYGKEILAAVDKSIVAWRGALDDSPTPNRGLILGTNDTNNACYLKLEGVFDSSGISYSTGTLPKPDTTPRTVWIGNKQVQVSQPPQPPRTLIRVGIIG